MRLALGPSVAKRQQWKAMDTQQEIREGTKSYTDDTEGCYRERGLMPLTCSFATPLAKTSTVTLFCIW